ncbi:MAG: hypothetical protein LAO55_02625 [Acidobacteriia bacterium]|nr:hypothetical protein [Terriglobia bacterium]
MTRLAVFATAVCLLSSPAFSQGRGGGGRGAGGRGGRGGAAQTPRASAAIDMTGYWVSVVTEDWMFRMVTPPKGQFLGVPLNGAARQVANGWDPAKDEAAGEQCKSYGAAVLMRVPGRLHITWDNDTTLKVETEAGTQTRLFHFGGEAAVSAVQNVAQQNSAASWQGYSVAEWEKAAVGAGEPPNGDLKVVTTRLRPGYLRKNGIPYSENAIVTEWYDRHTAANGDIWLVVSTEVKDPQYLTEPFITSTHFKKLPDNAPWKPEACSAR